MPVVKCKQATAMLNSLVSVLSGRRIFYKSVCFSIVRTNLHRLLPVRTQSIVTYLGQLRSSTNSFDPRLRNFLLEIQEKNSTGLWNAPSTVVKNFVLGSSQVQPLYELAKKFIQVENDMKELQVLKEGDSQDGDLGKMIKEEYLQLQESLGQIQNEVIDLMLEEIDQIEGVVMEISAGVGGQEAMLFCSELLDMYCNYCDSQGWESELSDCEKTELEGIRHASLIINHPGAYKRLRFESGVHRVQRVPKTEKAGRIHTSTVAVAIIPRPSEVTVKIDPKDLKIETKRASGAGGQHVNTTESAVRITHLPTGLVAECQTQRSQPQNRQVAMEKLRARLYQIKLDEQLSSTRSSRKLQVGTSSRSEKIRTYNFPQDRITDHRINFSCHSLDDFLCGSRPFETLLDKLQEASQKERLVEFLEQLDCSNK